MKMQNFYFKFKQCKTGADDITWYMAVQTYDIVKACATVSGRMDKYIDKLKTIYESFYVHHSDNGKSFHAMWDPHNEIWSIVLEDIELVSEEEFNANRDLQLLI